MTTGNNLKQKTLTTDSNLANLLPTGTVLTFQALLPSFSNNGECSLSHKHLTLGLIFICSVACFLSSFTDSFVHADDGKLYYGIATRNGLYVFNDDLHDGLHQNNKNTKKMLKKYHLTRIDFVHAIGSLIVFLVVSISSPNVQDCFFSNAGPNEKAMITNLPLGAGFLASVLFMIFPTRRRGIGYGDKAATGVTAKRDMAGTLTTAKGDMVGTGTTAKGDKPQIQETVMEIVGTIRATQAGV
ncbi:hypothetical protein SLE2022_127170 [Rubroshorea leprosula]